MPAAAGTHQIYAETTTAAQTRNFAVMERPVAVMKTLVAGTSVVMTTLPAASTKIHQHAAT